ncbi:MAG: hypothetical protein DMG14_13855 [Acidobacteria bacterium]|nr:MAG: hypothetical protein DMG14_13855 [Acidobacteriota bacterium]
MKYSRRNFLKAAGSGVVKLEDRPDEHH